jgi:hypothetical protein
VLLCATDESQALVDEFFGLERAGQRAGGVVHRGLRSLGLVHARWCVGFRRYFGEPGRHRLAGVVVAD